MFTGNACRVCVKKCLKISCAVPKRYSTEVNVIKSQVPDINIPQELIHECVWEKISLFHHKTALVCLETGRNYTFHDVYKKSKSLARFLRKSLNLELRDTVAIILPNVPEYAIVILGAIEAGLRITTVNPIYTPEEISKQLKDSNTKLVFTLNSLWPVVTSAVKNGKIKIATIKHRQDENVPRGAIQFSQMCDEEHDSYLDTAGYEDTAFLPYSSGTTGLPKGVMLTHKNIVSNIYQMQSPVFRLNLDSHGQQDVVPVFLPLFHIYGLMVVFMNMFTLGCKLVTVPKFSSQAFMKLLEEHRPTITYAVPPIILMVLNNHNIQYKHMESVRVILSAAAPLGGADVIRFREKTHGKIDLIQMYGLTETSPIVSLQTPKLKRGVRIGSSGMIVANTEFKIAAVDDPRNVGLGVHQSGELLIRGPQNMKGYYNNEKATREVLVENGWLRTGDIAHYDEDEYLFVTDRIKELIKVKGFQVAPAELEEVLRSHPSVEDAAVVGVDHPIHGEVPKAFIVVKKGDSVRPEVIKEYVASKVASYKNLIGGVDILDSIPKNASGKLLRRQLKNL